MPAGFTHDGCQPVRVIYADIELYIRCRR